MKAKTTANLFPSLPVEWLLPAILSTIAGAVDVIGFLALGGLFTAHITGNLVVLAAHYLTGGFGQIGPLLSVPVFIAVLGVVTLSLPNKTTTSTRRALLILHATLLAAFLGFAAWLGPFPHPDAAGAVFSGMLGVAAMATQNALIKVALPGSPSTAVMTTNTTQMAVDLALFVRAKGDPTELARARHRIGAICPSVIGFIAGCSAGGALELHFRLWALTLPVALALVAVPLGELWRDDTTP
jgi:uncharacterized membrane protein YoaK (UPF0700 family)